MLENFKMAREKDETMYLSLEEKKRRYGLVREMMKRESIDSLLVIGSSGIGGPMGPGNFRYLTDFLMIFNYGLLLFFAESEPVMLVGADLTQYHALKQSWIDDVRISKYFALDVVSVLKERKKGKGRLGVADMESLPASIYQSIRENLTSWEMADVAPLLLDLRLSKSKEEQLLMMKAAEITDNGFQAVLKMIRPGVTEREIIGILEGFHRGHGSDQTFNIIFSGPFPVNSKNDSAIRLFCPSERKIEKGDIIVFEMTATYGGYWNQLVRAVSVGKENRELSQFHKASLKTIEAGVKAMRPGVRTSEFVKTIDSCVKTMGYRLNVPVGHYVGLDLVEVRVNPEIELVLKAGAAAIIHPILSNADEDYMFWGQTYLIMENKTVSLNSAPDELVVVQ